MPTQTELSEMKGEITTFDKPPANDVCPICFDEFAVPCKTNCGHWFCAKCILRFWSYAATGKQCNCPICSSPITRLSPEVSLLAGQEAESVLVLQEVQRYNALNAGGWKSLFFKILALPFFIRQLFRRLRDLDRVERRVLMQAITAMLELVLQILYLCGFISEEMMQTLSLLSWWGNILCLILLLILVCNVCLHQMRARRLAARRPVQARPANLSMN